MKRNYADSEGISLPKNDRVLYEKETGLQIRSMILRNAKNVNKSQLCKVYIEIVSIFPDGKKSTRRIPVNVFVNPKHWNKKVTKSDPEYEKKNILIDKELIKYKTNLLNREVGTWTKKELEEIPVAIADMFPKTTKTLTDYIDDYIKVRKSQKTPLGTLKEFTTCKNRLKAYESTLGYKLTFSDMNILFSNNLYSFLLLKPYSTGTIEKTYSILRTILNYFYEVKDELSIELSDKFRSKRWKKGEKSKNDPHPISNLEFNTLLNHVFESESLNKTKDRFLLQCSSGMRYSDLFLLKPENIKSDCIEYYPVKTIHKADNLVIVPLNDINNTILKKYDYDTSKLGISNQKYNLSLKEMFVELNKKYDSIDFDNYSTHDGRDTFITYSIAADVGIPYLLKMVGQNSYDVMKRYFKIDTNVLKSNMKKVSVFSKVEEPLKPIK